MEKIKTENLKFTLVDRSNFFDVRHQKGAKTNNWVLSITLPESLGNRYSTCSTEIWNDIMMEFTDLLLQKLPEVPELMEARKDDR